MFVNVFLSNNRPFSFFIIKIMFAMIKLVKKQKNVSSLIKKRRRFSSETSNFFPFAVPTKFGDGTLFHNIHTYVFICQKMSLEFVDFLNAIRVLSKMYIFISTSTNSFYKSESPNFFHFMCVGQVYSEITGFRVCLHKILFWFLSFID